MNATAQRRVKVYQVQKQFIDEFKNSAKSLDKIIFNGISISRQWLAMRIIFEIVIRNYCAGIQCESAEHKNSSIH